MNMTRRQMIARTAVAAAGLAGVSLLAETEGHDTSLFPRESLDFLQHLTQDVVQAARVRPGETRNGARLNNTGAVLIMPGGNYPAYWIRDFAMSLDSGFITPEEMAHHLRLTARCQNGSEARHLKNGLIIPPYAIPDHILFDGKACFYPGTYGTGADQGDGTFGFLPPIDDHYEFIHIAHRLYRRTKQSSFLGETIDQITLLDRLIKAFEAPAAHPATGMVVTSAENRAVGFGFCDAIYFTGKLLFPSLLRYRAASQLAELCQAGGQTEKTAALEAEKQKIARHLIPTFGDIPRIAGWLMAATGIGRQPDVWGTLYALHLGALTGADAQRARKTITESVSTITCEGAVRHVPTDRDASPTSAWEKAACAHNTYQNGAYWHTPTGWLIEALLPLDRKLAGQIFQDYIQHLRQGDYRLGKTSQAPWECFGPKGVGAQNGVYMTSVALPWPILRDMANERNSTR